MRLDKSHLVQALERLSATALLLLPKTVEGITKFAPYCSAGDIALEAVNTLLPPKDDLFPATERLYGFQSGGTGLVLEEPMGQQRQIIFGIRPCDVYAISCLDKVFLAQNYGDSYYAAKRGALTMIAITCSSPAATCFCESMGIDLNHAALADVELRPLADGWQVAAHSEAGREVLQLWQGLLKPNESGEESPNCACTLAVDTAGLAEKLPRLSGHPLWQKLAQPCLSCGVCAYLCPTCHCFDIGSASRGQQGEQFRCWDSCMFTEYSAMAGGHNPRPNAAERLANRFMHKLAYFPQRYGQTLCTGCGRCLIKCPAHIHITDIITASREVEA